MSLIIKKNTTFKIPRTGIQAFLPSSLAGLSLWLKADAGISTTRLTYVSQIILNGAYNTDFNGTYTATSEPDGNGDYSLNGPVYTMTYNKGANEYVVAFNSQYNAGSFISSDGVNWSILNSILNPAPYISGITGTYSNGNGQYGYAGDDPRDPSYNKYDNENYYSIDGGAGNWTLTYYEYQGGATVLATNSNTIPNGNWTNVNATGTITSTATLYPDPNQSIPTGSVTTSEYGDFLVTEWADQSVNVNNANPYGEPPIFNASDLNSKPTISLTSMSDYVERVFSISINPLGASGSTAFSVQYVEDVCGVGDDNGALLGNFGASETQTHYPYGPDCLVYDAFATTSRKEALTPPTAITDAWSIYSVHSTDAEWKDYVNGQLMHSDPSNTYSNSVGGDDTTLYIGKQTGLGNFSLKGKVAEVIVYNRVLTTPERQQVEAYLNSKYQIY